jgi:peptidoglycan/LPS O-acetylase OafA/YrhL
LKASVPPASRSRQPDVEALRGIAALMVVAAHLPWYQYFPNGVWPSAPHWLSYRAPLLGIGGLAVVMFLVISGAGLCRLLVLRTPRIGPYLRTRVGRLFGVFWAVAVPVLALWFAVGWLPLREIGNSVLVLLGLGFVSTASASAAFPSWWYMGIAWQVVLVVPLMVWAMRRFGPLVALAGTAAVVIASCYLVPLIGAPYDLERALILGRALEVVGGVFLALELWPEVRERLGVSRRQAALLVVGTIVLIAGMYVGGLGGRWLYRGFGLAVVAVIVYVRPLERWGGARLSALAVSAGAASFALYLLHEPVMSIVRRVTGAPTHISLPLLGLISLVAVVPLAVLFSYAERALTGRAAARAKADVKGEAA